MMQGIDKKEIEFTELEGALSEMQYEYRKKNRFRQLALLVIARNMPKTELEGLEELFARLDVNKDGQLSVNELRAGLRRMDSNVSLTLAQISPLLCGDTTVSQPHPA